MFTLHKDRVLALWEPLPNLSGCLISRVQDHEFDHSFITNPHPAILYRVIASVAYDLARRADGGPLLRPDHLADLCYSLSVGPHRLQCLFDDGERERIVLNVPQRQAFLDLLMTNLKAGKPMLEGEVRTPWDDSDLHLFANKLIRTLTKPHVRFL